MVKTGRYVFFACNDNILNWWSHTVGAFMGRMNTYRNTITLTHGIDEDMVWESSKDSKSYNKGLYGGHDQLGFEEYPYPSLLFTKTAARLRPDQYGSSIIKSSSRLDPKKKTVLFLCKETCHRMLGEDAKDLSKHFNLVISPHPKYLEDPNLALPTWAVDYVVDPPDKFPSTMPLLEVADVVIGQPSSLMSAATRMPAKKLIVLPLTPPGTANANLNIQVLDNATALLAYERPQNWTQTVYEALEDTPENQRREHSRASYFSTWFGCVDGYEDYRLLMLAFEGNFNFNISKLSALYYGISDAKCSAKQRSVIR